MSGPIGSLIKNKKERNELPFVFKANGVEYHIQVRVRGKSRLRVCDFSPLRFNFSDGDTNQTVFADQDNLKLVTYCRSKDVAETDTLQEFAAYRIFNLISDAGYRVRLLRITYRDTDERRKDVVLARYGFLIESQSELADRIGGRPAKVTGVSLRSLDDRQAALVYVFQYMIGNTDWSMAKADDDDVCCHNGDILEIESKHFYVPYDFDLAGLVNAKYAYPDPALRIRKVTQRMYRGYCTSRDTLQSALGMVRKRKADILGVLSEIPGLPEDEQAMSIDYLSQFFTRAEDEEKMLQTFERRCL
ncbi:MAG: hypothetical protein O6844_07795 [Gammaproteobacteria bacterium]|nr:hypothetical protein [Gammaproteobacteria bacterium]